MNERVVRFFLPQMHPIRKLTHSNVKMQQINYTD